MSADNWAVCPVCLEGAIVNATGPVDEYDFQTFREDYEFYIEGYDVKAAYSGFCTQCGSGTKFTASHPIVINSR